MVPVSIIFARPDGIDEFLVFDSIRPVCYNQNQSITNTKEWFLCLQSAKSISSG